MNYLKKKNVISWALYDWANSAFATTVMAGFFPIFFKAYWANDLSDIDSTAMVGYANSFSGLVVVILAPILGAFADLGAKRKRFLGIFASLGIVCTASFYFVPEGQWVIAALLYGIACIGFSGGNIFYDSLIVTVSDQSSRNQVSALGYSLGYLGGGILFLLNVLMYLYPESFNISSSSEAVLLSFMSVAVWWALFSLPLFKNVKESTHLSDDNGFTKTMVRSFKEVYST